MGKKKTYLRSFSLELSLSLFSRQELEFIKEKAMKSIDTSRRRCRSSSIQLEGQHRETKAQEPATEHQAQVSDTRRSITTVLGFDCGLLLNHRSIALCQKLRHRFMRNYPFSLPSEPVRMDWHMNSDMLEWNDVLVCRGIHTTYPQTRAGRDHMHIYPPSSHNSLSRSQYTDVWVNILY